MADNQGKDRRGLPEGYSEIDPNTPVEIRRTGRVKKPKRMMPQWYSEKVNMAAEVFAGNPDYVDTARPVIQAVTGGKGINAQRVGLGWGNH